MQRFLLKIAVFGIVLLACAWIADRIFTDHFRDGNLVKAQWQHHMKDQHFDVVFIGSSRGWWNIDMNTVREECGQRAINLSNNHFGDPEVLLSLKYFLANGNRANHVYMQVDHDDLTLKGERFSSTLYDYIPYIDEPVVNEHLAAKGGEWIAMRDIPFWRYSVCNFKWGVEQLLLSGGRKPLFDSTGTYFSHPEYHGPDSTYMHPIPYQASTSLKEIIALCKENDMELSFFMAPYYRLMGEPIAVNGPSRAIAEQGFVLHDHSRRLHDKHLFNDIKHINIEGGKVYTKILIDEMICPDAERSTEAMPE